MQVLHNSRIGDFTRGGQVIIHFMRMIGQVIHKFFSAIVVLYVMMTIGIFLAVTDPYDRYLAWRYVGAHAGLYLGNADNPTYVERNDAGYVQTTIRQVAISPLIQARAYAVGGAWVRAMVLSASAGGALVVLVMFWLLRFGASHRKEESLRGEGVVNADLLTKVLRSDGESSPLKLAGIPIVKGTETTHILVTGSPGSGKTTSIFDLLSAIRRRGDRCICYSPSGDFIERFYRGGDTILNPFDARCPTWDLWRECRTAEDHYMVASSIIPDPSEKEPLWNNATRQVVAAISEKLGRRGMDPPTIDRLMYYVTRSPDDELKEFLKDTDAAALVNGKAEGTAANIRTNTVAFIRSLRFVPQGREQFSIRSWVERDAGKDWIFLNARPNQLPSVRPLLSMWLQVFATNLMGLPDSQSRRVWMVIDELPSLQQVKSLYSFLAEARKYGGCGVIAFQQLSQLQEIYGDKGAANLVGLAGTWVCMRQNDPDTAEFISKKIGEIEVMENQQGISYGANEIRDGVSLNAQRKMRRVVTPTQIMQLDNLEGYLKVVGKYPTGHFVMTRQEMKKQAPSFIPTPAAEDDVERVPGAVYREMAARGVVVAQVEPPPSEVVVAAGATATKGTSDQSEAVPAMPLTGSGSPSALPTPAAVKTDMLRATDKVRLRAVSAPSSKDAAGQGNDGASADAPAEAQTTLNFEASTGTGSADA